MQFRTLNFDLFVNVLFEPVESLISLVSVLSNHCKSENTLLVFESTRLSCYTLARPINSPF